MIFIIMESYVEEFGSLLPVEQNPVVDIPKKQGQLMFGSGYLSSKISPQGGGGGGNGKIHIVDTFLAWPVYFSISAT